jgi:hypothetical protein
LLAERWKSLSRFGFGWWMVGVCAISAFSLGCGHEGWGQKLGKTAAAGPAEVFAEGKRAMQGGDLKLAEEDFRRVIALDPKSGAAHINLVG